MLASHASVCTGAGTYKVLAEFDKYPTVLLENFECSLGTAFVACFQHLFPLFLILNLLPRVKGCSITIDLVALVL